MPSNAPFIATCPLAVKQAVEHFVFLDVATPQNTPPLQQIRRHVAEAIRLAANKQEDAAEAAAVKHNRSFFLLLRASFLFLSRQCSFQINYSH